jgi:hypothetical protein
MLSFFYFIIGWIVCFGLVNTIIYLIRLYLYKTGRIIPINIPTIMIPNQNFIPPHKRNLIIKIKEIQNNKDKSHPATNLFK